MFLGLEGEGILLFLVLRAASFSALAFRIAISSALNLFDTDEHKHILVDTGASSNYLWENDCIMSEDGKIYPDSTKIGSADAAGKPMQSKGRINAKATLPNGQVMPMYRAMLLSKRLRQRLLSVGEQTNHGYMFVFKEDKAHIFHNNILVKTVDKKTIFTPCVSTDQAQASSSCGTTRLKRMPWLTSSTKWKL